MSLISTLRRTCYGSGRTLGWARIAENIVTGHPERAVKQLVNKTIGKQLVRREYLKLRERWNPGKQEVFICSG